MEVAVLVENTSSDDFEGEHGLSFFVRHKGSDYLIDAGKSGLYLKNAWRMGIDLSDVDCAFLSHGHYDHSGGFEEFFKINHSAKVYLQEDCRRKDCYKIVDSRKKYIGIPESLLDSYEDRFSYVGGFGEIAEDVFICPHTTENLVLRAKRANMYALCDGELEVDDFSHEQSVVFREEDGLYVFNSCSHGGVENILDEIREFFPGEDIRAFFGGFHLMGADGVDSCSLSREEVMELGELLLKSCDATFFTGHCTGNAPLKWLREVLGERLVQIHTGMRVLL